MKILAIIPARSGSKGIPGKNILKFDGKNLISYACEAALESKLIDDIVVSSDSEKILNIAKKYNKIETHKRSVNLSSDLSPVIDTIKEIIQLKGLNDNDLIVLLQPTSPLRSGRQIDEAINMLLNNPIANSLMSIIEMSDIHPARMYNFKKKDNLIDNIFKKFSEVRRQDIPPVYYRNGSIYITKTNVVMKYGSIMKEPTIGYKMSNKYWLNIDDDRDLIIANSLIKNWKTEKLKNDSL